MSKRPTLKDGTYHKDVYLPLSPSFSLLPRYSRHAQDAASNDRYGKLDLPKVLSTQDSELIELEVVNGKAHKALLRKSYDSKRDLCVVVLIETGLVKTVWCNLKSDLHKTLKVERYVPRPKGA